MEEVRRGLLDKVTNFSVKWAGYSAFGSFLLYLFGYLALRFQLYTYGVATNLDVFDERYLFAGCRFLVFIGVALPNILFLLALLLLPLYAVYRLTSPALRSRIRERATNWLAQPYRMAFLSSILALLLIQFVLKQCLFLSNMLLRDHPPDFWIHSVLLWSDGAQALYFDALLLGIGINVALVIHAARLPRIPGTLGAAAIPLLVSLVAIEILFLPVNYGILIGSTWLPRVSQIEPQAKSAAPTAAWLVWDSKDALTYLVCDNNSRALVSMPKKDNRISVIAYDPIFPVVTRPPCSPPE
ncbi:MAG: hypothetical protein JO211_10650 [Acidobacteriaceae bacterium]|nr:hypothetical protein [Acidobacteriaceae bacterium]